ncbi:hypothetical protein GYMLUDRAFT_259049 [Collybiopsis luxurians FD-317 M1]|uniref:Uncharacterized protein n=1 Tax=Collybiopsis luxurians FD-317 M1 TaxID=944289 RepID=A0A0D0CLW9_9AGAR|nr:hypothetical protein GYMLUDRAFT_259049 [Collybiopsis luxurians FD-317 M1]
MLSMQKKRWYSAAEPLDDRTIALICGFVNGGYINRNTPIRTLNLRGAAEPTYEFYPASGRNLAVMYFLIKISHLNTEMPFGMSFGVWACCMPVLYDPNVPAAKRWSSAGFDTSRNYSFLLSVPLLVQILMSIILPANVHLGSASGSADGSATGNGDTQCFSGGVPHTTTIVGATVVVSVALKILGAVIVVVISRHRRARSNPSSAMQNISGASPFSLQGPSRHDYSIGPHGMSVELDPSLPSHSRSHSYLGRTLPSNDLAAHSAQESDGLRRRRGVLSISLPRTEQFPGKWRFDQSTAGAAQIKARWGRQRQGFVPVARPASDYFGPCALGLYFYSYITALVMVEQVMGSATLKYLASGDAGIRPRWKQSGSEIDIGFIEELTGDS